MTLYLVDNAELSNDLLAAHTLPESQDPVLAWDIPAVGPLCGPDPSAACRIRDAAQNTIGSYLDMLSELGFRTVRSEVPTLVQALGSGVLAFEIVLQGADESADSEAVSKARRALARAYTGFAAMLDRQIDDVTRVTGSTAPSVRRLVVADPADDSQPWANDLRYRMQFLAATGQSVNQ